MIFNVRIRISISLDMKCSAASIACNNRHHQRDSPSMDPRFGKVYTKSIYAANRGSTTSWFILMDHCIFHATCCCPRFSNDCLQCLPGPIDIYLRAKGGIKPCKSLQRLELPRTKYTPPKVTKMQRHHKSPPTASELSEVLECSGSKLMLKDLDVLDFLWVVEHRRFDLQRIHVM